ncbi:MAG: hypothetical protein COT38_04890 [Candidatus Omnitrophica bacterium CG08_land_8_20_14_0_20_41_16]|nr:MAG: hypothetical protein COT38_04890 [Candidatus Omnitrophica bacterium CG08_land_8_20_14_0_20_41_16]
MLPDNFRLASGYFNKAELPMVAQGEGLVLCSNINNLIAASSAVSSPVSDQEIMSRRDFLKKAAIAAAGMALNSTAAEAFELAAARSKQKPQPKITKQPEISKQPEPKEQVKSPYEIPVDDPSYVSKLQAGILSNLKLTNQLEELLKTTPLTIESLIKYAEYSNSKNNINFIKSAYALLNKEGLYSSGKKQYRVLLIPDLKKNSGQAIVLEDLDIIVIGREAFLGLGREITIKWLAVRILQEVTRANENAKGKIFLENEIRVHKDTLDAMKRIGGMPRECVVTEENFLHAFNSIVNNKENKESVLYAFGVNNLERIGYDEDIKITARQGQDNPRKVGIIVVALKTKERSITFGITPDGMLGGVTKEWLKGVETNSLFIIQRDFLADLSKGSPIALSGLNAEDSIGASSAVYKANVAIDVLKRIGLSEDTINVLFGLGAEKLKVIPIIELSAKNQEKSLLVVEDSKTMQEMKTKYNIKEDINFPAIFIGDAKIIDDPQSAVFLIHSLTLLLNNGNANDYSKGELIANEIITFQLLNPRLSFADYIKKRFNGSVPNFDVETLKNYIKIQVERGNYNLGLLYMLWNVALAHNDSLILSPGKEQISEIKKELLLQWKLKIKENNNANVFEGARNIVKDFGLNSLPERDFNTELTKIFEKGAKNTTEILDRTLTEYRYRHEKWGLMKLSSEVNAVTELYFPNESRPSLLVTLRTGYKFRLNNEDNVAYEQEFVVIDGSTNSVEAIYIRDMSSIAQERYVALDLSLVDSVLFDLAQKKTKEIQEDAIIGLQRYFNHSISPAFSIVPLFAYGFNKNNEKAVIEIISDSIVLKYIFSKILNAESNILLGGNNLIFDKAQAKLLDENWDELKYSRIYSKPSKAYFINKNKERIEIASSEGVSIEMFYPFAHEVGHCVYERVKALSPAALIEIIDILKSLYPEFWDKLYGQREHELFADVIDALARMKKGTVPEIRMRAPVYKEAVLILVDAGILPVEILNMADFKMKSSSPVSKEQSAVSPITADELAAQLFKQDIHFDFMQGIAQRWSGKSIWSEPTISNIPVSIEIGRVKFNELELKVLANHIENRYFLILRLHSSNGILSITINDKDSSIKVDIPQKLLNVMRLSGIPAEEIAGLIQKGIEEIDARRSALSSAQNYEAELRQDLLAAIQGSGLESETREILSAERLLNQIRNGEKKEDGYNQGEYVVWHGYSHVVNNTIEAVKAMLRLKKEIPDIPDRAVILTAIAGILHDAGYYIEDKDFKTIKVNHEGESKAVVDKYASQLGLSTGDAALVSLIISATQADIAPEFWETGTLKKIIEGKATQEEKDYLSKLIDFGKIQGIDVNNIKDLYLVLGVIYGAKILAALDIWDTRKDAVDRIGDLRKEFLEDQARLEKYLKINDEAEFIEIKSKSKDAEFLPRKAAEKGIPADKFKAAVAEINKLVIKNSDSEQIAGTEDFYNWFADKRVAGLLGNEWDKLISPEAKARLAFTRVVVREANKRLSEKGTLSPVDIKDIEKQVAREQGVQVLSLPAFSAIGQVNAASSAVQAGTRLKILLLEDESGFIELFEEVFGQNYDITVTRNAQEGFDIITNPQSHFDLAIFDVNMPSAPGSEVKSGLDLAEKVKGMNFTFPIVIRTASIAGDVTNRIKGLLSDKVIEEVWRKPSSLDELKTKMKSLTEKINPSGSPMASSAIGLKAEGTIMPFEYKVEIPVNISSFSGNEETFLSLKSDFERQKAELKKELLAKGLPEKFYFILDESLKNSWDAVVSYYDTGLNLAKPQGYKGNIKVEIITQNNQVRFRVMDNGPGPGNGAITSHKRGNNLYFGGLSLAGAVLDQRRDNYYDLSIQRPRRIAERGETETSFQIPVRYLDINRASNNYQSPVLSDKGGIDFRSLPAVVQPMPVFQGQLPGGKIPVIPLAELDNEWKQVENMLNAGIIPSSDRLKIYLQSCYQKQDLNPDINKVLSCIADMLRLEEEQAASTDLSLKEILKLLESDKPAAEMQFALAQIMVQEKAPKVL